MSSINTVERIVSAFPQPKKTAAQKKKEAELEKQRLAQLAIEKKNACESTDSVLQKALSWNNYQNISKKLSVGTLATSKYQEQTQVFENLNDKARDFAAILPQSNYFGQTPDPVKDPYERRKVKQLNDISFEESDEDEIEDVKSLKRLPKTIVTEESLKNYLGPETERISLEHHYWIRDNFIDKIGRMAPNIRELSLRRMNLTNRAFTCIAVELK